MAKSTFTQKYRVLLGLLSMERKLKKLTQAQIARRLSRTQAFVSKCESGERRIDVTELADFCRALGISLSDFVKKLEQAWKQ